MLPNLERSIASRYHRYTTVTLSVLPSQPPNKEKPSAVIAAEHGILDAQPAPRLDAVRSWVNHQAATVLEDIYESKNKSQVRAPPSAAAAVPSVCGHVT